MIGPLLALFAALVHAATLSRYGYFRDELYFIACAKHLAWGYPDQPPLVAFAAWLAAPFGYSPFALRILPALAAAATVLLAVRIVRELGGGRFAQALAGVLTALAPAYLLLGNTLTTTSFEPMTWTLAAYAAIRIVRGSSRDARWWVLLAGALAFGLYGKYSIGLLAVALLAGFIATPEGRAALRTPWLPVCAALTTALVFPNLWWQASHGWPFLEVIREDAVHRPEFQNGAALEFRPFFANALAFAIEQIVYTNPLAVPVWVAGLVAPFRIPTLRELRALSIAYAVLLAAAVLLSAKGYYIVGIYATLFAVGAVAIERLGAPVRAALFALPVAAGALALPLALPVLPIDGLIGYMRVLGLTGRDGTPPHLVQPLFAEEFGWDRLARDVAAVYDALPASERARTAVYADTYADAGAIDFYGPRYGLPPAISSQNAYYDWGPRGYDGSTMIAIGASRADLLRRYFRSVQLVRTSEEPYKWIVEGPAPIYLCRDPVAPLAQIWPLLRWYGA